MGYGILHTTTRTQFSDAFNFRANVRGKGDLWGSSLPFKRGAFRKSPASQVRLAVLTPSETSSTNSPQVLLPYAATTVQYSRGQPKGRLFYTLIHVVCLVIAAPRSSLFHFCSVQIQPIPALG